MKHTKLLAAMLAASTLGWGISAQAGPIIGFDPTGSGSNFVYADIWSSINDTGVDVGPGTLGSTHDFHTQTRVSAFTLNGTPDTPIGLNVNTTSGFELTKTISFTDLLTSITGGGGSPTTFGFSQLPQGGATNITFYVDKLGDGSQAVPGPGAGTVNCYGGASPCASPDGIAILTGTLVANTSSFTATAPGQGTGSFDLLFEITSHNANYLDLSNLPMNGGTGNFLFADRAIGTLNQPVGSSPIPFAMWDGTLTSSGNLFQIVSAEDFRTVPEPSSLALIGIALVGLGANLRRRRLSKA